MNMWPSQLNRNLGNCEVARKKVFRGSNGIRTRGLCVRAAVLYQLSYENPYTRHRGRLIYWVHQTGRQKAVPWGNWSRASERVAREARKANRLPTCYPRAPGARTRLILFLILPSFSINLVLTTKAREAGIQNYPPWYVQGREPPSLSFSCVTMYFETFVPGRSVARRH